MELRFSLALTEWVTLISYFYFIGALVFFIFLDSLVFASSKLFVMDYTMFLLHSSDKNWSSPVSAREGGSFPLTLTDDSGKSVSLIIVVKRLSPTITQVLISGELVVHNNLERSIDVRLVASSNMERQRYVTVNPGSRAPSIVLSPGTKYNLKLGLESQWSGLVPLYATSNSWLVKGTFSVKEFVNYFQTSSLTNVVLFLVLVPTKDKKDFVSVWCQIFREKEPTHKRILVSHIRVTYYLCHLKCVRQCSFESHQFYPILQVVISPMYLIKSLLPCDANVLIKTEELNVNKSLRVPGRGSVSNLITPGTTAHNHSLTFHIE